MTMGVEGLGLAVPVAAPLELRGRSLVAARLGWAAAISLAVFLFAVSIPARFSRLSHPPAYVRTQLSHAGLAVNIYAGYLVALGIVSALICCGVAALIVLHRPNDWIGLLASLYLVLMSLATPPNMDAVAAAYPALALPANFALFLFMLLLVAFFFVFPDGRFVPRWTHVPLVLGASVATLAFFLTNAQIAGNPPDWTGIMILLGGITGIAAQIYRYIRVSGPAQRQQTKWVALGVSIAVLLSMVISVAGSAIPSIGRADGPYGLTGTTTLTVAFLFVPLTLGVAILRYRLWDIDVVINRALVYSALSMGLVVVYFALVGGLEIVFQSRGRLPGSLLATALIALLFAPLRDRLQSITNRFMYGERDEPYRVLTRLGERVGAVLAPEAVLPAIAETVAHAMKSPYAAITLGQADALAPAAAHGAFDGVPCRLPLEYQGATVGELLIAPRGPGEEFSPADWRLLGDLARQIGPAAHAVSLTTDLRRSRERLVTAREEERRRLRRDLHDGLGPQLAALTLKIETIRNRFAADPGLDGALVDLTARTQAILSDIRRLVYGLRPPALDELGLVPAMQQAAEQYSLQGDTGLRVTVETPESLPPLPAAVEVAAYRIVQEALANVVRHSAARTCRVSLSLDGACNRLRLQLVDDGQGLPSRHHAGVGLVSMRERAEELGGSCRIASLPSGGTTVTVELPCPAVHRQDITGGNG